MLGNADDFGIMVQGIVFVQVKISYVHLLPFHFKTNRFHDLVLLEPAGVSIDDQEFDFGLVKLGLIVYFLEPSRNKGA